jgi:hypothetical protein
MTLLGLLLILTLVRQYVAGMTNATQLLDLLAAEGSEEIEPTMAAAARRRAIYSDVSRCSPASCRSYKSV